MTWKSGFVCHKCLRKPFSFAEGQGIFQVRRTATHSMAFFWGIFANLLIWGGVGLVQSCFFSKKTPSAKDSLTFLNPWKQRKTAENTQNTKEFPWWQETKEKQNTKERTIRAAFLKGLKLLLMIICHCRPAPPPPKFYSLDIFFREFILLSLTGKLLSGDQFVHNRTNGYVRTSQCLESVISSGHLRPRQGTEICNFGAPAPLDFFLNIFLQWIFFLFLQVFYVVWQGDRPKTWRKLPDSRAETKVQNPDTSLAVMVFSVPISGWNQIKVGPKSRRKIEGHQG